MVYKKSFIMSFVLLIVAVCSFASAVSAQTTHTVQPGETLSDIARRYQTTITQLATLNNISNPNFIVTGQQLRLPGSQSVYYVKSGDTLSGIASSLQTTITELVQRNGISNPNFLRIGQAIRYVDYGQASSSGAPANFVYRVRSGDSLSSVAKYFKTSVSGITALNANLTSSSILQAKSLIRIPSPPIVATIHHWATVYGVPSDLLLALTWWESGWDNNLVSWAGAIGIGQLIPSTVDFVSEALIGVRLSPWVPAQNVRMSARFMAYLLAHTNNSVPYALAAYYQGLGAVQRRGIYNSSWGYVNGIQALRVQFR